MNETRDLPKWLWLYLPLAILPIQVVTRLAGEATYATWMRGEISVPEIGTVVWLVPAVITGVLLLLARRTLPERRLVVWIALLTFGCFYFCGEEMAWGQSYFHWRTPEAYAAHNAQKETTLHNIAPILGINLRPLFDNVPRNLLTLGAIIAVVIVIWARRRPDRFGPDTKWHWIWPTYVCVPAALLAQLVVLPGRICTALKVPVPLVLDMQGGEFKEYFLALTLMLYVMSLRVRLRAAAASS